MKAKKSEGKPDKPNDVFNWRLLFTSPKGSLFWTILYIIGMFAYTAIMFGLAIGAVGSILKFKSSDEYDFTQELLVNWNKDYVNDITTVLANQNCPAGYELWHNIQWPGINKGCDCIDNNAGFKNMVTAGECTTLKTNSNCDDVSAMSAVPLYFWKQQVKVCVQRETTSFFSSPENCGEGLKRCGTGKVRFCVEEAKQCPITDVVISTAPEMDGYTLVPFTDTQNIFYSRDDANFPISNFKIAEDGYCIFDAQNNIAPGKLDYVLSKVLRKTCPRYETRYVVLDTQGEKALYEQNDLYTTLKNIPGYPRPSNDVTWNLGFVRYFQWDDLCRNGIYSMSEAAYKIGLHTILDIAWVMFGVTLLSIVVTGIIIPIRHLKNRIREEHVKKMYQKKNKEYPKKNFKKFFTTPSYLTDKVFKLIIFPVAILAIFFTQREKKWFVNAQLNQCGDEVTNSYFDTYASKLDSVQSIFTALVFFWLIMLLADVVYAIYLVLKSNIAIAKFFTSKIHRKEEKIILISEEEMRGLNKSTARENEKDSGSGSGSGNGSVVGSRNNIMPKEAKSSSSSKVYPVDS